MEPLSFTGRRWRLGEADPAETERLSHRLGMPALAARCLLLRAGSRAAADWLQPSMDHLHDPWSMRGLPEAVDRIRRALARQEHIRVVTDYDVDGTTSSLILQATLGALGGRLDYHIPHRMDEGYGFSVRAAESAATDGVGLLLTADIGVRDHAAVTRAAEAGVDVIVCDHHLPAGEAVPERALAVLCPPQRGCTYPNKALAACGVSFKLAQALLQGHPRREALLRSLLKLAAIGTVADVVDLSTLENRAIVALGLAALQAGPHAPGLQALLETAGMDHGPIDASDLGFRLGPRINAAGRLAEATAVVELLAERDLERARERAKALERLNTARQGIQERLLATCADRVGENPPEFPVLWGSEEAGWHRGVVGIVAARLRDRLHRPVAVAAVSGDEARGSIRSIPEVHAVQALDAAADLLTRWGGHPIAAGFTARADRLAALGERLSAFVRDHAGREALVPTLALDAACAPRALDRAAVDALARLGPHGKGNPAPMLRIEPTVPKRIAVMGGKHLRFDLGGLDAVWWQGARHAERLRGPLMVAASAGLNAWQGRTCIRLTVEDAWPG